MNSLIYVIIVAVITIGSYFLTGWFVAWFGERQEAKDLRQRGS